MTIVKTVKKIPLKEQKSDTLYWLAQSFEARITALEEIRREYLRWTYDAEPRLQRVYTIVKRT